MKVNKELESWSLILKTRLQEVILLEQ